MYKIVLASQSPRRKELIKLISNEFVCIPSELEEVISNDNPVEVVKELSYQKANDIANQIEDHAVIIGADTIVVLDGQIMGKPKDEQHAIEMLKALAGRVHQVFTGLTIIIKDDQKVEVDCFAEETLVTMYPMSEQEIIEYVSTGEPMDKAGAYGIQGLCAKYIQKIDGEYNNVVGLPVARLYQELKNKGLLIKNQL